VDEVLRRHTGPISLTRASVTIVCTRPWVPQEFIARLILYHSVRRCVPQDQINLTDALASFPCKPLTQTLNRLACSACDAREPDVGLCYVRNTEVTRNL